MFAETKARSNAHSIPGGRGGGVSPWSSAISSLWKQAVDYSD